MCTEHEQEQVDTEEKSEELRDDELDQASGGGAIFGAPHDQRHW